MRVVVAVLCVIALIGCQRQPPAYDSKYTPPPAPMHPAQVAIIGDSYTGGSEEGGYGDKGWPQIVQSQLRREDVNIRPTLGTDGGSGYVTRGQRGSVFADQVARVVKPEDPLVVVFGSRNDNDVSAAEFTTAVERTFAAVKTTSPNAKLLVIGPPWVNGPPPAGILQARDILRSQSEAVGAVFVDPIVEGWFVGQPELIGSDGVHPTDAGHAYMAEKIAPHIRAIFAAT